MSTKTRLFAVLAVSLSLSALAQPAVPTKVNFTARLVDNGTPVTGTRNLVFSLYPTLMGGSPVWTETRNNVTVTDGTVNVDLGASTPLTDSILDGQTLYLEVTVGTQVLTPRTPVLSVPYALRSTVAARLGALAPADVQERVDGTCPAGSAIRTINADGTVTCQAAAISADAGTTAITAVVGGPGLTGGGTSGSVSLAVDFAGTGSATTAARSDHAHAGVYLPVGMSRTCMTGQKVTGIGTDGNVTCTADTVYDVVSNGGLTRSATNQFSLMSCSTGQQLIATSLGWGCTNPLGVQSLSATAPVVVTGGSTSTPSLSLGTVPVANGGTGAVNAGAARQNLGAAASGSNGDITALTGLTTPLGGAFGGTGMAAPTTAGLLLKSSATGWTASALAGTDLPAGTQTWAAQPGCAVGSVIRSISASGVPTCDPVPPQLAAPSTGGLVVGGTSTAPTIGLVTTGCPSGATMRFNGASWGCITDVISVSAPNPTDGGSPSGIVVSNPNGPNVNLAIAPSVPNWVSSIPACASGFALQSIARDGTPVCVQLPVVPKWASVWFSCNTTGGTTTCAPGGGYIFGSGPGTPTITRTGVGAYTVVIPWIDNAAPIVMPYGGSGGVACRSAGWGSYPLTAYIACFSTTTGTATDTSFNFMAQGI